MTNLQIADINHREASKALHIAKLAYRARQIGDAEYVAAAKSHKEALAAWEKEAALI